MAHPSARTPGAGAGARPEGRTAEESAPQPVATGRGDGPEERLAADAGPDGHRVLGHRVLVGALVQRGDLGAALALAQHGIGAETRLEAWGVLLDLALEQGRVDRARAILAEAEVEGAVPASIGAQIRARIALAAGDLEAAQAILVAAVEAEPAAGLSRTLLAEVMVAAGRASDVRAVLSVLGTSAGETPATGQPEKAQAQGGPDQRLG
jgi:thioredoxin-like negative regulator of GroEL